MPEIPTIAGGGPPPEDANARFAFAPRRPVRTLDRYLVLEELGRGGMGVVVTAYDSDLDRRVALKLLRPGPSALADGTLHERLLREAQAMARLSHPNVVQVFDVGTIGDEVFVAMELVEGETLAEWLQHQPLAGRWRSVVPLFVAAGQGLAAAHDAGLVHRDFKPSNVLIGRDGRIRVADFGIALAADARSRGTATGTPEGAGDSRGEEYDLRLAGGAGGSPAAPLTEKNAVVGTPGYIAPEVLRGEEADPRSDQYAFCVALYEALFGAPPIPLGSPTQITRATLAGPPLELPLDADVPAWLRAVVQRGLAVDPADRFPSMRELLAELGRDRRERWRRIGLAASVFLAVAAVAVATVQARRARAGLCAGGEQELAGIWDGARRSAVAQAFAASGRPFATAALAGTRQALDAWSSAWTRMRREACEATRVRSEQSAALLDLRMQCLDQRLDDLRALTDLLATADAAIVERAVQASHELPSLEPCADAATLTAPLPPPATAEARRQVAEIGRDLARGHALWTMAKLDAARDLVGEAARRAAALDYPPVLAAALRERSRVEESAGEFAAAETTLYDALAAAQRGRHDLVAAQAWTDLAWVVGFRLRRFDDGERWGRMAAATIARLGRAEVRREVSAELDSHLAMIASARGTDRARALALQLHALEEARQVHRPGDPALSRILNRVGVAFFDAGQREAALRYYREALAESEAVLGPQHPTVAIRIGNIALVLEDLGRLDEALAEHRRALAIEQATIGDDHPQVAATHGNIGLLLSRMGRSQEALTEMRKVLSIQEKTFGRESSDYGASLVNLATVQRDLGKLDAALATAESARRILVATMGPEHPWTLEASSEVGRLRVATGQPASAIAVLREAIAGLEKDTAGDRAALARDRFALARALWATGGSRDEARALAEQARGALAEIGQQEAASLADVVAWLAAHGARRGQAG